MKTLDVLVAARKLLKGAGKWAKGGDAFGKSGQWVDPRGRHAVCFCANGAIQAVSKAWQEVTAARSALQQFTSPDNLVSWNDRKGRTKREVLALFGKAIAFERAKEP